MKKLVLFTLLLSGCLAWSQIEAPQPSPAAKVEQKVGLTDVTLNYSRPSMKGRVVFGNLVPYDVMWRTGANANSVVTFSDEVTIGCKTLKKGSYAVFTKPSAGSWSVYFYADTNNWGMPANWDDSKVAAMINVPVQKSSIPTETFTMEIGDVSNNGATLHIRWENTHVSVPFMVPTESKTLANINKVLAGPSSGDYYTAAVYYLEEGKDIAKAKEWMDKAISMSPSPQFWQYRQQSLIYAKAGLKKEAIEIAKKSLQMAEAAGNADYVKMNKDSLKEWGAK